MEAACDSCSDSVATVSGVRHDRDIRIRRDRDIRISPSAGSGSADTRPFYALLGLRRGLLEGAFTRSRQKGRHVVVREG